MRILAAIFALLVLGHPGAQAAELVMFEEPGCGWCERWEEEVGVVYDMTPEGRRAPLRRLQIDDPLPAELRTIKSIAYTPTFVIVENGVELGRIVGYPGEDFFWAYMAEVLAKAVPRRAAEARHGDLKLAR